MSDSISLARFKVLVGRFSANFDQWPAKEREQARILLVSSREALRFYNEERRLDHFIAGVSHARDAELWLDGEQEAAMQRLYADISGRIAVEKTLNHSRRKVELLFFLIASKLELYKKYWREMTWMTAGGGVVAYSGLWIGELLGGAPLGDFLCTIQMTLLNGR